MSEDCPETDIEFDAWRFASAQKLRRVGRGNGACSAQRGLRAG